jgi:hypothetical protein
MYLLKTLRAVLALNLIAIFVQFTFAGLVLDGKTSAVGLHGFTGLLLVVLAITQTGLAIAMRSKGLCPAWLPLSNGGIIVVELIEAACGHFHVLPLHVPLALAIFGGVSRQMYWATREALGTALV